MALTRAQLLMGNKGQGTVLSGEVQGVKQGVGVKIEDDGTIRFDYTTAPGVVKLNNVSGYNSYVWPSANGDAGTFLCTSETGTLTWQPPSFGAAATVDDVAPEPAMEGMLWYDTEERLLKIFEKTLTTLGEWAPVTRGNPVVPLNVTSSPALSGAGTLNDPLVIPSINTVSSGLTRNANLITISGLAPNQFVMFEDTLAGTNQRRFYPSNQFADSSGNLYFYIYFQDFPPSVPDTTFQCKFKVGFEECYISFEVGIVPDLMLTSVGTITGTANVGETLTYVPGTATDGLPPISYTWAWKKQSDGSILQTNGELFTLTSEVYGDRVFVELTATDSTYTQVKGATAAYPLSPELVGKGEFPSVVLNFPTVVPGETSVIWTDADTTLSASGCIEFQVDSGGYGQGPTPITNGQTLTMRWIDSASCTQALTGTTIVGCIFDDNNQACGSFTIDRVPSPFSFTPASSIIPGNVASSNALVPMGINSPAYVTYSGTSTATNIQANINNSGWVNLPLLGTNTVAINPGQTIQVRATSGVTPLATYNAIINIGQNTTVQTSTFAITTGAGVNFTTSIPFPTTTIDVPTAVTWADGTTNITGTGCIEFSKNSGSFTQSSTSISNGDTITTRWISSSGCGLAAHGTTITGSVTDGTKTDEATLIIDRVPAAFSFTNLTNQSLNTVVASNILNMTGFNAPAYITYSAPPSGSSLTSVQARVGGGSWTAIPSSGTSLVINPDATGSGTTLQIRGTTGGSTATNYGVTVNIGESTSLQTTTWTATTSAVVPSIATPTIINPVNGSTGVNPYAQIYYSPPYYGGYTGITLSFSAYTPLNGAPLPPNYSLEWEVRSGSITGPIIDTGTAPNVGGKTLSPSLFAANTTFFVKGRYVAGTITSAWSSWSQFTTIPSYYLSWTLRDSWATGVSNQVPTVCWVGGATNKFILGVPNGSLPCRVSSDGVTWTPASGVSAVALTGGAGTQAGRCLATGTFSSIRYSDNGGNSWLVPGGTIPNQNFGAAACGTPIPGGRWVIATYGALYSCDDLASSNWILRVSAGSGDFRSIIWDGSRYVASCSNKRVYYSTDGITWSYNDISFLTSVSPGQILFVPGTPDRYVLIAYNTNTNTYFNGGAYYAVSTDLVSWTAYLMNYPGTSNFQGSWSGAVGGGQIVFTGSLVNSGYYLTTPTVASCPVNSISPFPIVVNAAQVSTPGGYSDWVLFASGGCAYSPTLNKFVACAVDRFGSNVYTYTT